MVRKGLLALGLIAGVALATPNAPAQNSQAVAVKENGQSALKEAIGKLKKEELSKVIQDAAKAFQETNQALLLLQRGKTSEALTVLKRVDALLQKLINQYGLVKLPVDVQFVEFNGITDLQVAQEYNKRVKELVAQNNFVDARFLLALLRDEIDVITTYMPLDVYKQAIDLAVKMLEEGKTDAALLAIQSALGTLEVETVIVPKPILEAQLLVQKAQEVYKVNPAMAKQLVSRAEYDLKLAVALGYIRSEEDIKPLVEKLEELKKAITEHAANIGEKFQKAKEGMKEIRQESTVTR
ncbi:MAG TPA: YfdX family protein [Aquificales bacterium]|nr:YfdX family protein [Aquificales bacterium]